MKSYQKPLTLSIFTPASDVINDQVNLPSNVGEASLGINLVKPQH